MNTAEFLEQHDKLVAKLREITEAKNKDYSGSDTDPFANFNFVERIGRCSAETGIYVRMCDKMSRLNTLLDGRDPAVKDEKVEDTLLDLANYSLILAILIDSKKPSKKVSFWKKLVSFFKRSEGGEV